MAMWKYLKYYDEKIFENIFFEILSLPYFRKFSHSKISTYTVTRQWKWAVMPKPLDLLGIISLVFRKNI